MVKMKKRSRVGLFVHFRNMETLVQKIYLAQHDNDVDDIYDDDAMFFDK